MLTFTRPPPSKTSKLCLAIWVRPPLKRAVMSYKYDTYISLSLSIYLPTYLSIYIYLHLSTSIYIYLHLSIYLSINIYIYVCRATCCLLPLGINTDCQEQIAQLGHAGDTGGTYHCPFNAAGPHRCTWSVFCVRMFSMISLHRSEVSDPGAHASPGLLTPDFAVPRPGGRHQCLDANPANHNCRRIFYISSCFIALQHNRVHPSGVD